jgi:O-methyltransferase domain
MVIVKASTTSWTRIAPRRGWSGIRARPRSWVLRLPGAAPRARRRIQRIYGERRSAIGDPGTLLLVEAVLPMRAADQPAAIRMDLHMLTLLRRWERTETEFAQLLGAAGFELTRIVPTRSVTGLCIIEATPDRIGR